MWLGGALPIRAGCTYGCSAEMLLPPWAALPPDVASFRGVSSFYNTACSFLILEPIKPSHSRRGMWGELIITALCLNTACHLFNGNSAKYW